MVVGTALNIALHHQFVRGFRTWTQLKHWQAFRDALQQALHELQTRLEQASYEQQSTQQSAMSLADLCYRCGNYGPWHGFRCLKRGFISED
jgi:hypothetical protein